MSDGRTELTVDEIVSAVVKESPYDVTPYDVMKRMIEGQRETIDELTSEYDRLRDACRSALTWISNPDYNDVHDAENILRYALGEELL